MNNMNKRLNSHAATGIILVALLLAYLAYLVPAGATATYPLADHWRMAIAALLTSLCLGAAVIFLLSLKAFKAGMRKAYQTLAAAIILLSLGFMQFPIAGLFSLWDSWWINGGGAMLPFIVTGGMMYAAMRRFGRLLHITGFLMSFKKTLAATGLAAIVIGVIATFTVQHDVAGTNIYIAAVGWTGALILCAALITRRIIHSIGKEYQVAMRRLELAFVVLVLACAHECVTSLFVAIGDDFVDFGIFMWPFVVGGALLVFAGQAFSQVGAYNKQTESVTSAKDLHDSDYLDSITGIASLASRPEDIDPILDEMRKITASLEPGTSLRPDDKKALVNVYTQVEQYLIRNDPLRNFTIEELRQHSQPAFVSLLTDQ
jgi:hypothetical protein